MHPSAPTFATDAAYGLWWRVARSTGEDICAIDPAAWLLTVRAALGLSPRAVWDANFAQALLNAATVLGWDAAVVESFRADLAARRPSRLAAVFATYFAIYRPSRLRFDGVSLRDDLVLPAWGQVLQPRTDDARLVCYRPSLEPVPSALSPEARRAAEAASALGVRVRAGEPAEQWPEEDGGPGSSRTSLGLGVLFLLVAGALFVTTTRLKREPARKPARGRTRLARANPTDWLGEAFAP